MSTFSTLLSSKTWTLPVDGGVDGTLVIGWCFVFLAYFLHPAIESAYHRLRAYRAWRCIQKRQTVEVTTYPLVAEVFGGRGKWDAARNITVILAAFSLASWGLELSMDLSSLEGEADLLNRPPPVFLRPDTNDSNTDPWEVLPMSEISSEYGGDWQSLGGLNIKETYANSRYYIVKDTKVYLGKNSDDEFINGNILVARWSTEEKPSLFYDTYGATVGSLECSGETLKSADVYLGNDRWGTALDCERGPVPSGKSSGPPTIILSSSDTGMVYVIVEESSSYPTFLYSVWTASDVDSSELSYSFHIESTIRLAEAVVTGIVNGQNEGGGCFALLRLYSETREPYENDLERASPFGELPTGDTVRVEDLETIEAGVEINMNALLCLLWVLAMTAIGVVWSFCLRSSIGIDVYDRDELLRAVSLQGRASKDPTAEHPAIRIFVRREDSGNMTVFINDTGGEGQRGCTRFLRRGGPKEVAEPDLPERREDTEAAQIDDRFGGAIVPDQGTVSLGGTRTGTSTPIPGQTGVSLCASPVRSNAGSTAATPMHGNGSKTPNPFEMASPASTNSSSGRW
ncbi:unnamed protein product [Scytosiphon promiscuus]